MSGTTRNRKNKVTDNKQQFDKNSKSSGNPNTALDPLNENDYISDDNSDTEILEQSGKLLPQNDSGGKEFSQVNRLSSNWNWYTVAHIIFTISMGGMIVYLTFSIANMTQRLQEFENRLNNQEPREQVDVTHLTKLGTIIDDVEQLKNKIKESHDTMNAIDYKVTVVEDVVSNNIRTLEELKVKQEKWADGGEYFQRQASIDAKLNQQAVNFTLSLTAMEIKLKNAISVQRSFNNKISRLEKELLALKINLTNEIKGLNGTLQNEHQIVIQLQSDVKELEHDINSPEGRVYLLSQRIDNVNTTLSRTVNEVHQTITKIQSDIKVLEHDIQSPEGRVDLLSQRIDNVNTILSRTVNEVHQTINKIQSDIKVLEHDIQSPEGRVDLLSQSIDNVNTTLSRTVNEVKETLVVVKVTHTQLSEQLSAVDSRTQREIVGLSSRMNVISPEIPSIDSLKLAFFVLTAVVVVLSAFMLKMFISKSRQYPDIRAAFQPAADSAKNEHRIDHSHDDILSRIVQPRSLHNGICIVSFYEETKSLHQRLVATILSSSRRYQGVPTVTFLVNIHNDIPNLPPSRIYFIFVDFNERNVILEFPERGLGDLKLTTVQAAHKMKGEVTVIYVRDGGSRNLQDGQLFNPSLTSITTHPELSVLNGRQRVLSIFDEFSPSQSRHLINVIADKIK